MPQKIVQLSLVECRTNCPSLWQPIQDAKKGRSVCGHLVLKSFRSPQRDRHSACSKHSCLSAWPTLQSASWAEMKRRINTRLANYGDFVTLTEMEPRIDVKLMTRGLADLERRGRNAWVTAKGPTVLTRRISWSF